VEINAQGVAQLRHVEGLVGEHHHRGDKLRAALNSKITITRVVVWDGDYQELSDTVLETLRGEGLVVSRAGTIERARELASGFITQVEHLLEAEQGYVLTDAGHRLGRTFGKWETFDALFVPPQLASGLRPRLTQRDYEELERQRSQGDYRGLNMLEKERMDLREGKSQEKLRRMVVPWQKVRDGIAGAVVLGDPGYGKTTLLWHEVGRRCTEALAALRNQKVNPHELSLAVFFRALEVARVLAQCASPAPTSLLDVLLTTLSSRHRLPDELRPWLREKQQKGHCLIALDGLDEVPPADRKALDEALGDFVRHCPGARLLLSSRLVGYLRPPIPLAEEDQLEVLAFDEQQMEQALRSWLRDEQTRQALWRQIQARRNLGRASR
jgi:hypothetical protein